MDKAMRTRRAMNEMVSNVDNADLTAKLSGMDLAITQSSLGGTMRAGHFGRSQDTSNQPRGR